MYWKEQRQGQPGIGLVIEDKDYENGIMAIPSTQLQLKSRRTAISLLLAYF